MKILQSPVYRKIAIIGSFILFGLVLGSLAAWFHARFRQWFWFNLPGDLLFTYGFLGGHILSSLLAWTFIGAVFAFMLKPRVIAWIMGVYVVVFGILWLWWEVAH